MASQDTASNGITSDRNSVKRKECINDRPIISQQPNQSAASARPPVAAKPRRKPPAPSPKPGKPPAPPIPSHKSPQSSVSTPSNNSLRSTKSTRSKDEQKDGILKFKNNEKPVKQFNEKSNTEGENTSQDEKSYDPSTNPFEEETEDLSSTNPFEEKTEILCSSNPFDEDIAISSPGNPFEEETDISPSSSNPFDVETNASFEKDSEIISEQKQTEHTTPQRSSQPPPLPTSPPSKARLSRSLSGIKVNSSQNRNGEVSTDSKIPSSSSTSSLNSSQIPVTSSLSQPSSSTSASTTIAHSASLSSSSLNVISTSVITSSQGQSPPPIRPKPPITKPSPSPNSKSPVVSSIEKSSNSPSLNPPPRRSRGTQNQNAVTRVSTISSHSESPEGQLSNNINSVQSSPSELQSKAENCIKLRVKATVTPPPPVPKKSPKLVPKPSSALSNTKQSPSSLPLSPPKKSQSPPAALTTTEDTTNDNVSIPQMPKSVETEDDLNLKATSPDPLSPTPVSPPLSHNLSKAPTPPTPDLLESTDSLGKPSGTKDESLNGDISAAENKQQGKDTDKKKVPPPLPKNPPRGRPLRRSISGPAVQSDTLPPPPPPPRVPALSLPLRSLSLQDESLTKEVNKSEILKSPVAPTETKDSDVLNSNKHPVAPLRKSRESPVDDDTKQESEGSEPKSVESGVDQLVSSSSVNSFSEDIACKEGESTLEGSLEGSNTTRPQPRPVPRKRLSRNSVEISKDLPEPKAQIVVSETNCQPKGVKSPIVLEHEYSEVYRGDSPEKTSFEDNSSVGSHQPSKQIDSNTEDTGRTSSVEKDLEHNSGDINDTGVTLNESSVKGDVVSNVSQDEPEATCDMLKEIEELLKNKLGVSDESTLISLSNEEIDLRISDSKDSESKEQTEEDEGEPVRPPRPKRDASLNREHSESLNNLNSPQTERRPSSASDFGPADGSKSAPPKPKRSTLPRVKRSVSDVTGSKCDFEGFNNKSDSSSSEALRPADEIKPTLPPRNESLRKGALYQSRQQALASADITTPPPLPPRNKPRSASMNVGSSKSDDPPPKPFLSSSASSKEDSANKPQSKATASPRRGDMSAFTRGALPASATTPGGVSRSPAPRPARKAPPPPPNAKRNATFGPGDHKSSSSTFFVRNPEDGSKSTPQASRETSPLKSSAPNATPKTTASANNPKVKKSKSLLHRFTSKKSEDAEEPKVMPDQDAEYHEISDHCKKILPQPDEIKRVVKPPPPRLPPRPKVISPVTNHQGSNEGKPLTMTKDGAESSETSSEGSQSAREKRAQFALIKKVSQDIASSQAQSNADAEISSSESKDTDEKVEIADDKQIVKGDSSQDVSDEREGGESNGSGSLQDEIDIVLKRRGSASSKKNLKIDVINQDRRVSSVSTYSTASDQDDEEGAAAIEDESSHSDTDPEDAEAIYAERKAKKVFNIAQEIASSEKTFVDVLKLLNLDFRIHISKETEKHSQPIILAETLNKILDFLPQLQNFNEDLLKDLEHRVKHWEDNPCLSDIFVKKGPFLKLYSSYIRNFENSTAILDDACKKNHLFGAAVKDFEMSPKCGKLALKHFMLKPIQRIPQYKLLLQEYLKNLHPHSQDYKNTTIALNIVTEVADHANESMRHGDNVQKLLEIQRSLIGQFEVIQPGREFIKQGELQKVSRKVMQPRMFFLFSDVLLYTTPVNSGFKLNNILPLSGMKINNPKLEVYKYEFNIIGVQRSFTLCASSSQDKKEWLAALHSTLDENMKRFNTFESHKGPQNSLIDKDFVLGTKAPLWVPDARVTMCMLCLSEFTITWRRHHCRSCGRIICYQCSNNKAPLRYLQYKPARVCNQCYDKLHSDMLKESQEPQNSDSRLWRKSSFRGNDDVSHPASPTSPTNTTNKVDEVDNDSSLSFSRLLNRFHRIRKSGDKRNFRPSVLKEVHANDEGSDMSGYLRIFKNRKWKKLWFVVKGKVLYTYKASEDMAARESMPLLGYEVTRMNVWYEGAEPDLLFELSHQNTQPLVSKTSGDPMTSPRVMPDLEKTKQRLIFRTDSATAVTKWLDVLRAASCT